MDRVLHLPHYHIMLKIQKLLGQASVISRGHCDSRSGEENLVKLFSAQIY